MSKEKDDAPQLSEYANTLDPLVKKQLKKRYMQKIACIGVDPFLISCQKYYAECLPPTESIDLVSYLVLETSHYNKEQFKAFKSLQAYNQLVSGFVQSVRGLIIAVSMSAGNCLQDTRFPAVGNSQCTFTKIFLGIC